MSMCARGAARNIATLALVALSTCYFLNINVSVVGGRSRFDTVGAPAETPGAIAGSSSGAIVRPWRKSLIKDMGEEAHEAEDATRPPTTTTATPSLKPGKLVFLFVLRDKLPHTKVWQAFFSAAKAGSYLAFAHCVDQRACESKRDLAKLGIKLVPTIASKWCTDLVSPMYQLLRHALADAGSDRELTKFAFVSDSALPMKPVWRMREILLASDTSDICICARGEWASTDFFGARYSIVKHHQWVILSRRDAVLFVDNWDKLSEYRNFVSNGRLSIEDGDYKWSVARMGSDGRANASEPLHRSYIVSNGKRCPDEEVFTSLIFGLHDPSKDNVWQRFFAETRCRTYVNWNVPKNPPEVFSKFNQQLKRLVEDPSDSAYLFARKMSSKASSTDFEGLIPAIAAPKPSRDDR